MWCNALLLILLLGILYRRAWQTFCLTVIILLMVGGNCARIMKIANHQRVQTAFETERTIRILPDQIRINGNRMRGVTRADDGQRYIVTVTFSSRHQLDWLKSASTPIQLKVRGTVEPLKPSTNENQFDPQRFYNSQAVVKSLRGDCVSIRILPMRNIDYLHYWRCHLLHYFRSFPQPLGVFCNRLLLGIDDEEFGETLRQVRVLGIIHLFCLSGLHVTVLCNLIRRFLDALNIPKEWITGCQIIILPIYWVIGGSSISLTRAVLMMELGLFAQLIPKLRHLDSWSLSLIIQLVITPGILLNLGGRLSYLLSFTLQRIKWQSKLHQTIGLTIVSLPVILNATYQVHLLTIVINWLMIPLFSLVIIPLVLICALMGKVCPLVVLIGNGGLLYFQRVIQWLASLPGTLVFGKLNTALTFWLVISSILAVAGVKRQKLLRWIIILTYVSAFIWYHYPLTGEVTFFDIGQGDSILIREPFNRRIMMIDTGGRPQFKVPHWKQARYQDDDAQRISVNYLRSKGIHHLDLLFLSHRDADHIGNVATICRELTVKKIVVPSGMEKLPKLTNQIPANIKILPMTNRFRLVNTKLQILHPFGVGEGKNEDSLVLYGRYGGRTFIFSGDLGKAGERRIVKEYPKIKADIVKLGHHGSKTSSDEHYLRQLNPQLAIISAGRQNRYGHPNQETITTLNQLQIPFWSTQDYGMIKYSYYHQKGKFKTTLKGDEFAWMH